VLYHPVTVTNNHLLFDVFLFLTNFHLISFAPLVLNYILYIFRQDGRDCCWNDTLIINPSLKGFGGALIIMFNQDYERRLLRQHNGHIIYGSTTSAQRSFSSELQTSAGFPAMLSPNRMVSRASFFNFYVCGYCINCH
jgi:hypothetical protein